MKIKKLNDLLAVGIELEKQNLPEGFINTVWVDKDVRVEIYKQLLQHDVEHQYWKVEKYVVINLNYLE